jgi:glycosyltransferase involved in cell wall biosynthesis
VVYEALASGLPVVTTPNAGSIVRDDMEGFIVPIRNPEALAAKLGLLAAANDRLGEMSVAALARSRAGSLRAYGRRLLDAIHDLEPGEGSERA